MSLVKKLSLNLLNLIILIFFLISSAGAEESIFGKVRVIDGDTIVVNKKKIRLFGIDAPEMKQICKDEFMKDYDCGVKSRSFLQRSILLKLSVPKNLFEKEEKKNYKVWCNSRGKDRYGRILGICGYNFLDAYFPYSLNAWMVKNGHAVAYKEYSKMFIKFEDEAKKSKKGIWQGEFERPNLWRKKK